jgi:hypothetical protein
MATPSKKTAERKVTYTPIFRASYAFVFRPRATEEGKKPKYTLCMLFPKKDPKVREFLKGLKAECEAIARKNLGLKVGQPIPNRITWWPLRDGDTERDGEEFKGMYFLNSTSGKKPGIVDKDLNPIMDEEEFYSGCWAIATINPYWYDTSGNKGVAIGLNNLKKMRDDEPLSGGSTAEQDFGGSAGDDGDNADDDDLI